MDFVVGLLILSGIGVVYNEPVPLDNLQHSVGYDGSFAGLLGAFTGEANAETDKSGRFLLSLLGSQNKSCSFTNSFGFGNASCTLFCLVSGHQQGGVCASDGYCTCYV